MLLCSAQRSACAHRQRFDKSASDCLLSAPTIASLLRNPVTIKGFIMSNRKGKNMKVSAIGLATCFALIGHGSFAQGAPSGRGSTTGDPAASSQNANPDRSGMSPNKSGSGTSTSGGKDANGDQGRDKMPESNSSVRPAPGKPDIPDPTNKK